MPRSSPVRRTTWWEELLSQVECRLGQHWTEVGVALCNVAYEEQEEFESAMEEILERFAKSGEPQSVLFANGPEARRDYFLGVVITETATEARKKQIDAAARMAFANHPEASRLIVIGWPPKRGQSPYETLAVLRRKRGTAD